MSSYWEEEPEDSFMRDKAEHPDFTIVPVENVWAVWHVDFITQERKEMFGLHKYWWQAERDARKMQCWASAEGF